MPRNRQIYQTDLLYVGPTGANPATGSLFAGATPLIAQLYRVQRADYNWSKQLQDVNQFGELAAIDRVSLQQPTVGLTFSYLLSNFINEKLLGFTVNKAGDLTEVSALSGILATVTDSKNYFVKTVAEGADAADNAGLVYNSLAIGNGFLASYTSQGSVGGFPSVDISVEGLNINGDSFTVGITGNATPAVRPIDGTAITAHYYKLPTGLTSYNDANLTADNGLSVIKPGDITLALGLTAGDGFFDESDLKIQSYNLSFNFNREDLQKLGSKYAFAKVPVFPVQCTMSVTANVGEFQTGSLVQIVNDNKSFNPSVTLKRGDTNATIAKYTLKNAKLDNQDLSSAIGSNKSITMNFVSQMAGPEDLTKGLFLSGITV
jgi:hypothetical protein